MSFNRGVSSVFQINTFTILLYPFVKLHAIWPVWPFLFIGILAGALIAARREIGHKRDACETLRTQLQNQLFETLSAEAERDILRALRAEHIAERARPIPWPGRTS